MSLGSNCKETRLELTGWKTSLSARGCICVLLAETGEKGDLCVDGIQSEEARGSTARPRNRDSPIFMPHYL